MGQAKISPPPECHFHYVADSELPTASNAMSEMERLAPKGCPGTRQAFRGTGQRRTFVCFAAAPYKEPLSRAGLQHNEVSMTRIQFGKLSMGEGREYSGCANASLTHATGAAHSMRKEDLGAIQRSHPGCDRDTS